MSVLSNLFGEWTLRREWGRIGRGSQVRMDLFGAYILNYTTNENIILILEAVRAPNQNKIPEAGSLGNSDLTATADCALVGVVVLVQSSCSRRFFV